MISQRLTTLARSLIVIAAMLCLGSHVELHAQWQYVYGDTSNQAGRAGVQQTFDGGFVAVGESDTINGDYNVYVVKTDGNGQRQWVYTYDIGGDDFGKDIQQTQDSGYIVTGFTYDKNNCCTRDNLFLMKLNSSGWVSWIRVYGGNGDEQGWCVRELSNGELIVAGRTSSFGQGDYDGFLVHTTSNGTLLWARAYGDIDEDFFLGCTEVRSDMSGDIVVAGASKSYGNAQQGWLMRVALGTGAPIWSHFYGKNKNELFHSVRECSNGHFIIAGFTGQQTTGSARGLLVQTASNGAILNVGTWKGGGWSELTDAQETNNGNFITTGLMTTVTNGYGGIDVYASELTSGFATLWRNVIGGAGTDEGFSIAPVSNGTIIIAGMTTSFGNQQQLYLINLWGGGGTIGHCDTVPVVDSLVYTLDSTGEIPKSSYVKVECASDVDQATDTTYYKVCYYDMPRRDDHGAGRAIQLHADSSDALDLSMARGEATYDQQVKSYPNPVMRGSEFKLSYNEPIGGLGTVIVSDAAGAVVYRSKISVAAGATEIPISTSGWPVGTFLVQVRVGDRTDVVRVIVSD